MACGNSDQYDIRAARDGRCHSGPRSWHLYCKGVWHRRAPYAAIHADEVAEREREQMRLWYVATTRAMDFLFVGEVGHVEEMPFGAASDERRLG
ncbi:MAG: hypothetical protein ABII76_14390 [Pseudomonadota bacterium]